MSDILAVLSGGSRDGESTVVDPAVTRIVAASEAPGLLDVYEETTEHRHIRGNDEVAHVFQFIGQEPAEGIAPEAIHMPPKR
ncbi:MAG: hypothetical protein QOG53_1808 [Frankiales bacterium]|jgi:hypothetical protein|nr:hypothetical protein [Frankiales bacterium]